MGCTNATFQDFSIYVNIESQVTYYIFLLLLYIILYLAK